ncbi:hypothetical protein BH24ACT15_BH24ACT15_15620 [soil metagenome]|jgi:hypothetical protein
MRTAAKTVMVIVVLALVVVVLFTWGFPWFERTFVTDPTLTGWR